MNIFSTANVETLVNASEMDGKGAKQPSDVLLGKVAFLFNNLTQNNLSEKVVIFVTHYFVNF